MSISGNKLRGSIGVAGIVFLVVAAASPLTTVAGSLPVMIALGNGAGAPLTYVIAALVLLVFSVGYAAMSSSVADTGAFYAYVTKGLGSNLGVGAAGLAVFAYTTVQAGVYGLAANTVGSLVAQYGGPDLPWWVWAFVLIAIVGVVGYRNIDVGAKVLGVLLILEVIAIVALSFAVFAKGGAHGIDFTSFTPGAFFSGSPGIAMMFAIGSFVGFEATAIYSEEAKNPSARSPSLRTSRSSSSASCTPFRVGQWCWRSVVVTWLLRRIRTLRASRSMRPLNIWRPAAADAMAIMLVTSLFATLLAFHSAISRYVFALARRGYAPSRFAAVHDKHGSPHAGSLLQSASAVVLVGIFAIVGADPVLQLFTWMAGVAIVAILVLMVLTSFAIIAYFRRTSADTRVWHTRIAPLLGSLGLIAITALVIDNFTTLMGGSKTIANVFLAAVVAVFVGGIIAGRMVHARRARALAQEVPV